MKRFFAAEPFAVVAPDPLSSLVKTGQKAICSLITMDHINETTRCIQLLRSAAARVTVAFQEYRVRAYGGFQLIFPGNEKQIAAEFLDSV